MDNTNSDNGPATGFAMSNKMYDKAKWITTILLPALGTLYFTVGTIWTLPNTVQVIGTFAAITTFIGVMLGLSTKSYNASDVKYGGVIDVETNDTGTKVFSLVLNSAIDDLEFFPEITFKVNQKVDAEV